MKRNRLRNTCARLIAIVVALFGVVVVHASVPAAAATCGDVCQLYNGTAKLVPDTSFNPPAAMTGHLETSTVEFPANSGNRRMYYRTFKYPNASGAVATCVFSTGIAVATSTDGNNWTAYANGYPLPGLATTAPGATDPCPASQDAAAIWRYGPDAAVDGTTLRIVFEIRDSLTTPGVLTGGINSASSTDGITFTGERTVLHDGATGSWNHEMGTPDLIRVGTTWEILFHAHQNGVHFRRALAVGSSTFTNPFTITNQNAIAPQPPVNYPAYSWYDYGPGLGDTILENGVYYQIFEGFQVMKDGEQQGGCLVKNYATPRNGLAKSTNASAWTVSAHAPIFEISKTSGTTCGHDMPSFQRMPDDTLRIVTAGDPILVTTPPVRWKIVAGTPIAPPAPPASTVTANQYLAANDQITTANGYRLIMQGDGNLVEYLNASTVVWHSHTSGHPGAIAVMQYDGNLVIYGPGNVVLGSTQTFSKESILRLQTDGNLVVIAPGNVPKWNAFSSPGGL